MDLVLSDEIGSASIGILNNPAIPVGTFFIECIFTLEAMAPSQLQLGRYLPTTPVRILLDKNGNNLSDKVAESVLDNQLSPVKKQTGVQLVKALKGQIPQLVEKAESFSQLKVDDLQQQALAAMNQTLDEEHQRLTALAAINSPAVVRASGLMAARSRALRRSRRRLSSSPRAPCPRT